MVWAYGGFSLETLPYMIDWPSGPFVLAPYQSVVTPYRTRPGGTILHQPPGPRTITLTGNIFGTVNTGAWETARDTLFRALSVPGQRLQAGWTADRGIIAHVTRLEAHVTGPAGGTWTAEFQTEDAYYSALSPSGLSATPTLTLAPGLMTYYVAGAALTPGGSAPSPLRAIVTPQAGSVTPVLTSLTNASTANRPAMGVSGEVAPGFALVVDGERRRTRVAATATVRGWWPLVEPSGTLLDASGSSRDLMAAGVSYLQDGPAGRWPAVGFAGTTGSYAESAEATLGGTTALTASAWVYPTSTTTAVVLGKAGTNQGYGLSVGTNPAAFAGTGSAAVTATGPALPQNDWTFLALVANPGAALQLWMGSLTQRPQLVAQASLAALAASANAFRIGAGRNLSNTVLPFIGRVAEPCVWSGVLTEAQLGNVWQYGPHGATDTPARSTAGTYLDLDPGTLGTANTVQVGAIHGSTAPTVRVFYTWRARWS